MGTVRACVRVCICKEHMCMFLGLGSRPFYCYTCNMYKHVQYNYVYHVYLDEGHQERERKDYKGTVLSL